MQSMFLGKKYIAINITLVNIPLQNEAHMLLNLTNNDITDENLRLSFHTKFLALVFSIGLFLIFIVGYIALKGLKSDFDNNFPSVLNEINLLNEFQNQYIFEAMDFLQYQHIENHNKSAYLWNLYKNLYVDNNIRRNQGGFNFIRELYKSIFFKISFKEIKLLESQKVALIEELNNIVGFQVNGKDQKLDSLRDKKQISQLTTNIMNIETSIRIIEKNITNSFFAATINILCMIAMLIFIIVIGLTFVILNFMQRLNTYLKRLFDNATEELQNLNAKLQQEVKAQVEIIREKDRIMYAQSKLVSMGEMIQNIAHQWRQPLNSIILIIQAIKSKFDKGKLNQTMIDSQTKLALNIAENMSKTIDSFRSFFRMDSTIHNFNLKDTIQDSIAISKPIFQSLNIHINVECPNDIILYGNKQVLIQVLLVLFGNSKDAFIERNIKYAECFIMVTRDDLENKGYICMSYYDNCGGITEEILDKIFEPYFTTKHKSLGTGIGLYMARELLNNHLNADIIASNHSFTYRQKRYNGALFTITIKLNKDRRIYAQARLP
ncbi:HAMP domain-containing histidine kinase [Helicobacter muridarum]|uniref:histidine kinase n=1 Tax=Helicobacter muridarum TaxID=216 RepID=A0A377PT98_9HELI|nr:HAMP domain-containing sensor histidine kinase [Helicobacter muridarum]TLE00615.1 HAMP domain-containing histidine kinase [Helicobacter muridarum]STQ85632.1 two-component sensor histidine kinase [Helicobacter muridarum]